MAFQELEEYESFNDLSPLELAVLVCSVADEHCIVQSPTEAIDETCDLLREMCSSTFGRYCIVLDTEELSDLERFSEAVLTDDDEGDEDFLEEQRTTSRFSSSQSLDKNESSPNKNVLDSRKVASVVIAKNLHLASYDIQVHALELMRSRRIFSRTAVHAVPKRFLFVALVPDSLPGPPFLTPHLNDHFFISHRFDPSSADDADSFSSSAYQTPDAMSLSSQTSVVRRIKPSETASLTTRQIPDSTISNLQDQTKRVRTTAEIRRYTHNIPTFLRLHRAVAGGISSMSTRHLALLSRVLAPLHGLSFIPPSLIALAARKVYAHRLELVPDPAQERSMLWGSDWRAVAAYLATGGEGGGCVGVEQVLAETLAGVEVPL